MVQKESQAALEEQENELNSNPAASAGTSLEQPAAPAPGEDNPAGAGGAAVAGAAGGARRFLCGVVEEQLMTLISAAREYEIEFIYAISPGLDITFSNPKEVSTLKRKLDQVSQFGCRSFALLFDDIDHNMCAADKEVFSSFAHAQVSITNEIYQYLGEPETFLFCPTADSEDSTVSIQIKLENEGSDEDIETDVLYSPQMALKLALTEWLQEFGVPHQYSSRQVAHSGAKASVVDGTPLVAAPSLNATTVVTTVYQEPIMSQGATLSGEPTSLTKEEEKKQLDEEPMDMVVEKQEETDHKNDNQILTEIVEAKMTEELKPMDTDKESIAESKSPEMSMQEDCISDIAPMQTDEQTNKEQFVPGPNEKPLYTAEPVTLEDLQLLADLFYLPYEHGPKGAQMLREFQWLRANSSVVSVNCKGKDSEKIEEWRSRAAKFEEMCGLVMGMFTRLSNCANRTILYDMYSYVWDIKSIMSMVKSFVQWLGCELSGNTRSFTFKVEEEDDAEHVLALTMLCLTEGAKDECNVVEVVARNHDHEEIAVPVANLRLSCQPMLSLDDFQLQPPVTFRLKSGSGPVRITGRHQIVTISNDVSEEEESEEEGSEEEAELCSILPAKKQTGRP
ncbi:Bifunctional protein NCOAT [Tupaia chinensis]|uniref:Bifunctional protein NCOAT n=1 Tax=Tupaia chinensis TaxID=246437 RepID=L8Y9I5_TUPCH|nr:Bifunctional protein NCOAT [Tupaia chinensis]